MADHIEIQRLIKSDRHSFYLADTHPAIGKKSFVKRHPVTHLHVDIVIICADSTSACTAYLTAGEVGEVGIT